MRTTVRQACQVEAFEQRLNLVAIGWRQAAPVLEVLGEVGEPDRESAYELGGTLAALVMG